MSRLFFYIRGKNCRGCGAAGSASEWHSEGQGFEPPQLHQINHRRSVLMGRRFYILRRIGGKLNHWNQ